jgi:putative ABC transport system permease protein
LWPGKDAIGECFRMRADTAPCLRVVGVAEDMIQNDLTATEHYNYYIPLSQSARTIGNYMLIKTRGDPGVVGDRIRRELQGLLPGESYLTAQPLRDIIGGQQRAWRLGATLFSLFGVLAVIVAGVGLYGVIGYNVTQRLHELGVRAALGASRFNIIRLVVGQSVRYVLAGVVGGIAVAVYLADRIEPLLFQQPAIDPLLYGLVALFMVSVALFASALPARRAARVDPAGALRAE